MFVDARRTWPRCRAHARGQLCKLQAEYTASGVGGLRQRIVRTHILTKYTYICARAHAQVGTMASSICMLVWFDESILGPLYQRALHWATHLSIPQVCPCCACAGGCAHAHCFEASEACAARELVAPSVSPSLNTGAAWCNTTYWSTVPPPPPPHPCAPCPEILRHVVHVQDGLPSAPAMRSPAGARAAAGGSFGSLFSALCPVPCDSSGFCPGFRGWLGRDSLPVRLCTNTHLPCIAPHHRWRLCCRGEGTSSGRLSL